MVRMAYSVYRGAIRIQRGLLRVVEMDSGESSSSLVDHYSVLLKESILCVLHVWDRFDSIIRTIDGKILHKYKHPAAVFGCDWSQNNK